MQTHFTKQQLTSPAIAEADSILRRCVHCGFCTATCPTYVLLGDELDSPRGRIYLIKDMLENDRKPSGEVVKHIDRCLSCLSCTTTCPSGVDYMHLIDQARNVIEDKGDRPLWKKIYRWGLAATITRPFLFRLTMLDASISKLLFYKILPAPLKSMLALVPAKLSPPSPVDRPQTFAAHGEKRMRVALMNGCAQQVLRPSINEATIRLLTRLGCEVVVAKGAACCGALEQHMGKAEASRVKAKRNIAAWEVAGEFDAIVVNASGCGTTLKDYGHMLKDDPVWAPRAQRIADLSKDISEVVASLGLKDIMKKQELNVAYHSACSMQHGQKITDLPKQLLSTAGFEVRSPAEGHLCCGSAGTYNMTQPTIATKLGKRKANHLANTGADVVATGNIGCQMQITAHGDLPVVHTVELLDWATGGPKPEDM